MPLFRQAIWKKQLSAALLYWVVIPFSVLGVGKMVDSLLRLPPATYGFFQIVAGWVLISAGALLIWRSMVNLEKGGGTLSRFPPSKRLVTVGSYRICRHPMWLGYDAAALGVVVLVGSWGALLVSYPLLLFFSIRLLRQEERWLLLKFEKAYVEYCRQTPFLLPRPQVARNRR